LIGRRNYTYQWTDFKIPLQLVSIFLLKEKSKKIRQWIARNFCHSTEKY
jgi:hypothetical protein